MHGKSSRIDHDGKGIYAGIRDAIVAARYHSLTVKQEGLPDCLKVSAVSTDGEIMGVRHRDYPIEGVQFHPESALTEYGYGMLDAFLHGPRASGADGPGLPDRADGRRATPAHGSSPHDVEDPQWSAPSALAVAPPPASLVR